MFVAHLHSFKNVFVETVRQIWHFSPRCEHSNFELLLLAVTRFFSDSSIFYWKFKIDSTFVLGFFSRCIDRVAIIQSRTV